jgi:hypothetical protein
MHLPSFYSIQSHLHTVRTHCQNICHHILIRVHDCVTQAGVAVQARVLVDAMGSFSPIAAQARRGAKPDSVVLMVGSCATGLPPTSSADLLWSFTPINR